MTGNLPQPGFPTRRSSFIIPAMTLDEKLQNLPVQPGCYLHKNAKGEIIYIGKAKSLRNRVRQYFQNARAEGGR